MRSHVWLFYAHKFIHRLPALPIYTDSRNQIFGNLRYLRIFLLMTTKISLQTQSSDYVVPNSRRVCLNGELHPDIRISSVS